MENKKESIRLAITDQLIRQYPDMKPVIAEIGEDSFTFQLEKHGNYQYYKAGYELLQNGRVSVDWASAVLTVL